MSEKYKVGDPQIPHFITITTIDWVDLFVRIEYFDIITSTMIYCRKNKGLKIHAYCIMTSHLHLIVSTNGEDISSIIRDFKKHTSKKLISAVKELPIESRKVWLLRKFEFAGSRINRNRQYKVWQDGFHPKELHSNRKLDNAIDYIHENPVNAGFVNNPVDYKYSSASNYYSNEPFIIDLDII